MSAMHISTSTLVVAAVVISVVAVRIRSRRKRNAQLTAQWNNLQQRRAQPGSGHLIQVVQVYQRARRGSKAVITWCDTGLRQDAWFWEWHVPVGAFVLVSGQSGYGPHNHNPSVLYVHPTQVHAWVPAQAARLAQRQVV